MIQLGRQWSQRLRAWRAELENHVMTPVGEVAFEGFMTLERLTPERAETMAYAPYPVGTAWGGCWEYGWFRGAAVIPEDCAGRRIVFLGRVGGEQLVYADGVAAGSIDRGHPYVTLTRSARGGETVRLLIESYAGHGARLENLGPCPPERPAIPPVPDCQCRVERSLIAAWNEDAYQLLLDVETLMKLLDILPDRSLRAQKVARALEDFTRLADFELPLAQRQESFRKARAALAPALACHNGSTAPEMWIFGQSHIDLAWLWPIEETWHKAARTYSNQLPLLEEYPEYRFFLCEPALADMLRLQHPEVWQRVRAAYDRGQIWPEGAFYIECDTNIPSGESLIRQLLWGKRWFREHFGMDSQVAWQPDTFGFTAQLPQLLRGFGVPYFATQKLLRADPETERFPYQNFLWEGLDGSTVLALSFFKDNSPIDPGTFHDRWTRDRAQTTDIDALLHPFGYGDGGGGPTREMVEMARRLADLEGAPRSHYGDLLSFFRHMEERGVENRWVGELYLAWHRGTYTAQRRQKALMRRAERALHDAEALVALLPAGEQAAYGEPLRGAWEKVLLSQFHDVAAGAGIRRVHEEAARWLEEAIGVARGIVERLTPASCGLSGEGRSAVNPLPWPRRAWIDGLYVELPASGAAPLIPLPEQPADARARETERGIELENRFLRLTVDGGGRITALTDLDNGLLLIPDGAAMNDWRLYQNVEAVYDAWELSRDWEKCLIEAPFETSVTLTRNTPACCEVTVRRRFGQSASEQVIRLRAGSRRVDFETRVDWQERHRLLKVHFDSGILAEDALHEIQFGHVRRPAHRSHAFAADRYEVAQHRWTALCEENRGFAVLNDGCFGVSTGRGGIALTLLRAPLAPDDTCDQGEHLITYALYPFATDFARSGTVREGYELSNPPRVVAGTCEARPGVWCESDSVILETVKPAEDGDGFILRLYESLRMRGVGTLRLPFEAEVSDCGMAEDGNAPLGTGRDIPVALRPFEVKTLRVRRV